MTVTSTPSVGAVAVWDSPGVGHVAWVEAVNGTSVTVSDYNYQETGLYEFHPIASAPTAYIDFPGVSSLAPATGVDAAGDEYVFWKGTDGGLWEKTYQPGTGWHSPTDVNVGTLGSAPTVAVHGNGEQDVFWKGTDGNLWEAWNTGAWHGSINLGEGPLGSQPTAGVDRAGNQYVFWMGMSGGLWEKWYSMSARQWSPALLVEPAGTLGSAPTVAVQAGGEQDVFWKGTDGNLWETWRANNRWNGPLNLGAEPLGSAPSAASDAAGDQFVFWKGLGGGLWEKWYSYSANQWSSPSLIEPANTLGSAPAAAVHGQEDVFWKGTDGNLWEAWWSSRWYGPLNLGAGPL